MNTTVKERTEAQMKARVAENKGDLTTPREKTPVEVLREQMERQKPEFDLVLPPGVTVDRFVRTIMTAVQADPDLLDADRRSLLQAAMQAAQDGLLPDKREGAFVIYNTKTKIDGKEVWIKMVQWMPMIRGVIKKAREGGEIATLSARVVYENDAFEYVLGDDERIVHVPTLKERGNIIACYAIAQLKDGEREREVMTAEDVAAVRSASRSKSGPWQGPFEAEMWRKSVLRRLIKRLPMTPILEQIINRDESHYEFKDGNGVKWSPRPAIDAPPAPTRAEFSRQPAHPAEEAQIVEDDGEPEFHAGGTQTTEPEEAPEAPTETRTEEVISDAEQTTRACERAPGHFKTAEQITAWFDGDFQATAKESHLSKDQIARVKSAVDARLAALTK